MKCTITRQQAATQTVQPSALGQLSTTDDVSVASSAMPLTVIKPAPTAKNSMATCDAALPNAGSERSPSSNIKSVETELTKYTVPNSASLSLTMQATSKTKLAEQSKVPMSEFEPELAARISGLWEAHEAKSFVLKGRRAELAQVREELGKHLYALKGHLSMAGRSGNWAAFLRRANIPLSTADRYVARHAKSLQSVRVKLLTEEFYAPTPEMVSAMVKKLTPTLARLLTTSTSFRQFTHELKEALNPLQPIAFGTQIEIPYSPSRPTDGY